MIIFGDNDKLMSNINLISLLVRDYDEAIDFYVNKLGFELLEDTMLSPGKRWVRIAPKGSNGVALLLAKAAAEEQLARIGNQTGGRVFLFLNTEDFDHDFERLVQNNVKIVRHPELQRWGRVAVFEDLYGNLWDLIGK